MRNYRLGVLTSSPTAPTASMTEKLYMHAEVAEYFGTC